MSIVGIDFGSHTASFAIWHEDKNDLEVIADDLGSRVIPCAVAFRNDEIITGQSAVSQQHKNIHSTFDDVRSLIFNPEVSTVNVPAIEKEITVEELTSHFFRNLHNQIKQQVGKVVRDCVLSVPAGLDAAAQKRVADAAQAGGIRIKSFISDDIATLMAHNLDDASLGTSTVLVADIGWSKTSVGVYRVSGGMFFPVSTVTTNEVCGKLFVSLFADWCAKDFTKKFKIPCQESTKSMTRLRRECEQAMKSLSNGAEAMIDIDSLCEGQDYSVKVSRARFEDIALSQFMHLKKTINSAIEGSGMSATQVTKVCMSGGICAIPKVNTLVKSLLPSAEVLKGRFESAETQCLGAGQHGKYLHQQGLLDKAPSESPVVACMTRAVLLANAPNAALADCHEVFGSHCALPAKVSIPAQMPPGSTSGFFQLLLGPVHPADPASVIGEVNFSLPTPAASPLTEGSPSLDEVVIEVSMGLQGEFALTVTQSATKLIVAELSLSPSP